MNVRSAVVFEGRYMGYMRQLKPRQKALVRKILESEGSEGGKSRSDSVGSHMSSIALG